MRRPASTDRAGEHTGGPRTAGLALIAALDAAMNGHVLAEGTLIGVFSR